MAFSDHISFEDMVSLKMSLLKNSVLVVLLTTCDRFKKQTDNLSLIWLLLINKQDIRKILAQFYKIKNEFMLELNCSMF